MENSVLFGILIGLIVILGVFVFFLYSQMKAMQQKLATQMGSQPVRTCSVLGVVQHGNGAALAVASALSHAAKAEGLATLLVETDPLQPLTFSFQSQRLGHGNSLQTPAGVTLVYLNPDESNFEAMLKSVSQNVSQAVLHIPNHSPQVLAKLLGACSEWILALKLDRQSVMTLRSAFDLLSQFLQPAHRFLGIQVADFRLENSLQQELWQLFKQTHPELVLSEAWPEEELLNADQWQHQGQGCWQAMKRRKLRLESMPSGSATPLARV